MSAKRTLIAGGTVATESADPGHTEREDFTTGTMAAAAGGITTVFEHPLTYPPVTTAALRAASTRSPTTRRDRRSSRRRRCTARSTWPGTPACGSGLRGRRHGRLPRLRPRRLHDRGEGGRPRRHLPFTARLPGGADADVVLWDLESEWQVDARSQQFSKNPWSPFDGRRARARAVRTLVRGETVYAGGEILAEPGSGRFLSRQGDFTLAPVVA